MFSYELQAYFVSMSKEINILCLYYYTDPWLFVITIFYFHLYTYKEGERERFPVDGEAYYLEMNEETQTYILLVLLFWIFL